MATSGYFDTGWVGNFYFTFEWYRTGYNSSANEHYIHYTVYAHNSAGSYRTVYLRNLWIAGTQRYYEDWGARYYDGDVVTSGDITIPSSNSAGDGWFNASFEAGIGTTSGSNCSGEGSWDLDRIPRYTTVWNSERGKTLNTISVNWSTSDARDWTQYSLNDGGWQDAYDTVAWDNKSGHYTIHNLQPNTTYKVRTRCRRADSGSWSEAGNIWIKTLDIARISNAPNFNLGDIENVSYTNPSGSIMHIALYADNATDALATYRQCYGNSYSFSFTNEELKKIYKAMGKSNTLTARIYLRTDNNYLDYKTVKITSLGNIYKKVNGKWIRAKVYKKNNEWKITKWFYKVSGVWRNTK